MWWPFKKTVEKRLMRSFEQGLRLVQVSLFTSLKSHYLMTMEQELAGVLAAQVVNYLKGDDVEAVMQTSAEPLKSKIARIKDQVPQSAAKAMAENVHTREVIVATLRMRAVLQFMLQGKSYFHCDQHKRIEGLLAVYGPEFPDEIKPDKYLVMAQRCWQDVRQKVGTEDS